MRISHRHRFVYIAIPKTGSSTVRKLLEPYSDLRSWDLGVGEHALPGDLKNVFLERGWDWDSYHKFTVVRNPWARQLSDHNYKIKIGSNPPSQWHINNNPEYYDYCVRYVKEVPDFRSSVKSGYVIPSQCEWAQEMNSVCRLETLEKDLREVWSKLGLDLHDLETIPRKNRSSRNDDYRLEYDDESRDIVAKKFARDIEMFGYSF